MTQVEWRNKAWALAAEFPQSAGSLSNFSPPGFDNLPNDRGEGHAPASGSLRFSAQRILRRALPQACALCAARSGSAQICARCVAMLPVVREACPVCALPSPGAICCGACLKRAPPYAAAVAAWSYAFPVDRLVQALKYGARLSLAEPFAEALASAVFSRDAALPDAIVALPLGSARQRQRGFNQAQEIARCLARITGLPQVSGLRRVHDGPPQATLPWGDRARNVRRAFAGEANVAGRSIAIVDDVMTTGATLAVAAQAALRAGAVRVEAWVVARTLPPGSG
jgi:ComF family protein